MIHGDKEVNEYNLYQLIENKILFKDQAYFDKPLQWISLSLDRWCDNFSYGKNQTPLSDYDTIQHVNILLRSNLFFKFGNDAEMFEKELFENRKYFLDNLDIPNPKMLLALYQRLLASIKYISTKEFLTYKVAFIHKDHSSTKINRFYREAFVHSNHL